MPNKNLLAHDDCSVEEYIEHLLLNPGKSSLEEGFRVAPDAGDYLQILHDKAAVKASLDLPEVLNKIAELAKKGDPDFVKIFLDVIGYDRKSSGGTTVNVANQINLTDNEREQLRQAVDVG